MKTVSRSAFIGLPWPMKTGHAPGGWVQGLGFGQTGRVVVAARVGTALAWMRKSRPETDKEFPGNESMPWSGEVRWTLRQAGESWSQPPLHHLAQTYHFMPTR